MSGNWSTLRMRVAAHDLQTTSSERAFFALISPRVAPLPDLRARFIYRRISREPIRAPTSMDIRRFVDDNETSLAGTFDAQTRQAFKNLEKTLQRSGGTLKDIVWMTVAVSDGRYSQRFTDIRKEIYEENFPASTLLTVAAFAIPEIMVEITGIAVLAA